ncbi:MULTISPECIES: FecCD family ABC transporter permease [unclassified Agarivorans]|uniref:FecCD family ABC transporter permease n=1 Tax=unclassified Agarivorans TaxID=2636026 RepID=UPI003D7CC4F7
MNISALSPPRQLHLTTSGQLSLMLLVTLILGLVHLIEGPRDIPFSSLAHAIIDYDPNNFEQRVLIALRLPRVTAILLAGICLAIAGYLMQLTLANRLCEPHILGLNAGASLMVVSLTAFPIVPLIGPLRPLAASIGAAIMFSMVLTLASSGRKGLQALKLIFCGIAFSTLANAISATILLLDENTLDELRFWLVGDGASAQLSTVLAGLPFIGLAVLMSLLLLPQLNAMSLGDNMARGLGASVKLTRFFALCAAALLSGTAVSLVGPIGFVGLISPSIWRGVHARPTLQSMLLIALTGASLLLAADLAATSIISPQELPTGALTGLVGAPVFMWIFTRRIR